MNILLESRVFYPSIGGLEVVSMQLAEKWTEMGYQVTVVSQTPLGTSEPLASLDVVRNPSLSEWRTLLQMSDLFVQSGISLKSLPLALMARKPVVFIHHNMLPVSADFTGLRMCLKRWAARLGKNIAVSRAVAKDLTKKVTTVIHNPFSPSFSIIENGSHRSENTILFVGRLVSVKGVDIALKALAELPNSYHLIICGDGSERSSLENLASSLGVSNRVEFKGWVEQKDLKNISKEAMIQVVPSRYEPFGIVALEGIASGCIVVAANTGGLPEAVGRCGILVSSENPKALANGVLQAIQKKDDFLRHRAEHLQKFDIDIIAKHYIEVFNKVVNE